MKKIDGLGGITVNDRLYVTGIMDTFDKVKSKDKELARLILEIIRVVKQSIDEILD